MRSLRTGGEPVKQFQTLAFALGLDAMPEYKLGSGFVHSRIELEAAAMDGLVDGPSRKNFSHLGNIVLRVATVHAQGVQLQQLATVVFVQAIAALIRIWAPVGPGMRRNSESLRRVR